MTKYFSIARYFLPFFIIAFLITWVGFKRPLLEAIKFGSVLLVIIFIYYTVCFLLTALLNHFIAQKYLSIKWRANSLTTFFTWGACLLACVCFFVYPAIISPNRQYVYEFYQCKHNLHAIDLALKAYHSDYGQYPPSFTMDSRGNRMHSWRVLILAYLEDGSDFYDKYRFDEPWNSYHNKKLLNEMMMPSVFHCPSSHNEYESKETNYVMVLGHNQIPGGESYTLLEDADNNIKNVMVIEMSKSGIKWTEPLDLDLSQRRCKLDSQIKSLVNIKHQGYVNVLFCDGHIESISDEMTIADLKALMNGLRPSEEEWGTEENNK